MMWKCVDLEKGGAAVEPEEPWSASDDDDCIPGPGCVFGVLFGAVALPGVVLTLVCYGLWPALGATAVLAAMDYIVVLGAREGFKNKIAAMKAQAARPKYVSPAPCCIYAAMARERRDRLFSALGTSTRKLRGPPEAKPTSAVALPNKLFQNHRRPSPEGQQPYPQAQPIHHRLY